MKDSLFEFLSGCGVVYQEISGLIETADEKTTSMLALAIQNDNIYEISKSDAQNSGFRDIGDWAIDTDTLLVINNQIALCVPSLFFSIK